MPFPVEVSSIHEAERQLGRNLPMDLQVRLHREYGGGPLDYFFKTSKEGCFGVDWIDVFNLDQVERGRLESYIPDLGNVIGTPVAGLWKDGILGETGFGWRAITLISGLLGMKLEWYGAEWYAEV